MLPKQEKEEKMHLELARSQTERADSWDSKDQKMSTFYQGTKDMDSIEKRKDQQDLDVTE